MPKIEQIPLSNYHNLITFLETDDLPQNHDLEKMTIISITLAADLENRTSHADKSKDFVAKFHLKCSQILCVSFLLNFVTKLFAKAYESPTYIDNVTVSRSLNLLSCFFLRWMDNLKSLLSMEETAEVKSKLGEAQLKAGFGQFLSTSLRFLTKTGISTAVAATFSPVYEDCLYCGLGFMEDFYRSFIQQSSLETQSVTLLLQEQSMRNLSFEQAMETRVNRLIVLLRLLAESDSFSFWSYSNGQFSMTSDDAAVKQTGNLQFGKALATQYLSAEVESLKTKVTRKHGKNIPVLGSDNLWKSRIVIVTADVLCSEKMALVKKWIDCRLATIVVPFHVIGNLDREKKSSAYAREAIRVFEGALRHPESVVKIEPQTHEELEEVPKEYRDCLGCANSWIRRGEKYVVVVSDDGKLKDLAEQLDVRVISSVECDNNLKER
ncbi:hypothetical protein BKA69DRAFT_25145 [Paraphysoderma sedebokerense]|nr:hypothetical protein BKA69DRAFT_25145 [Paraphysoderma sedebokerense]